MAHWDSSKSNLTYWDITGTNSEIGTKKGSNVIGHNIQSAIGKSSGKLYFEIDFTVGSGNNIYTDIGLVKAVVANTNFPGGLAGSWGYLNSRYYHETTFTDTQGYPSSADHTYAIAVDIDAGKAWLLIDGVAWDVGGAASDPVAGTNPAWESVNMAGQELFPAACLYTLDQTATLKLTSAEQLYSPPTGFSVWDSSGATVLEVNDSDHLHDVPNLVLATDKILSVDPCYHEHLVDSVWSVNLIILDTVHIHWVGNQYIGPSVKAAVHLHFSQDPFAAQAEYTYHDQIVSAEVSVHLDADNTSHIQHVDDPFGVRVNSAYHDQTVDDILLPLLVNDTFSEQIPDVVVLQIDPVLEVDDTFHVHYADEVWSDAVELFPFPAIHYQFADTIVGALGPYVVIDDSTSEQYSDNVTLIYTNPTLIVNDCTIITTVTSIKELTVTEFPVATGEIDFPAFSTEFTFGITGDLDFPSFSIDGSIDIGYTLSGDIDFPSLFIDSSIIIGQSITGDLDFPLFSIDSVISIGSSVTGEISISAFSVDGDIYIVPEITGDIDFPAVGISGIVTLATDDDYLLINKKGGSDWESFA